MPLLFSYLSSLPSFILHFIMHYSAESPVHNTRSLFSTNHRDSLVFVFLHLVWVHFVNWQFRNWNVCTRKFPAVCLSLLLLAITRRCKRAHKNNHQNFICWLQFSLFSAGRFFSLRTGAPLLHLLDLSLLQRNCAFLWRFHVCFNTINIKLKLDMCKKHS